MPCSGVIHGPPVSLPPGELKIVISRPRRFASEAACLTASNHSGVPKLILLATSCPPPEATSARWNPAMPARRIHSRSFVIPSLVTFPFVQCHHVRGRAESGGLLNPSRSGSADCVSVSVTAINETTMANMMRPAERTMFMVVLDLLERSLRRLVVDDVEVAGLCAAMLVL